MKSFVSLFFLAFSKAFTLHLICLSEVFKIFYEIWNTFSWGKEYVVLILNCMNGLIYMASITKSRIILNGRCYFFNDYKIVNGIKKVEIFIWKYNFFFLKLNYVSWLFFINVLWIIFLLIMTYTCTCNYFNSLLRFFFKLITLSN